MMTMTKHGNRSTTPRGMETLELPRRRSGRPRKANLFLLFCRISFTVGSVEGVGTRFMVLRTASIIAYAVCEKRTLIEMLSTIVGY